MNTTGQEKLYIEVDEEITNVIDHIHRIKSDNILLVVPQRALLLQSVVNLKLMAQEAKKYNKKITLMTRDEDGIMFAARAGVAVQPFVAEEHESLRYEDNILPQKVEEEVIPQHAQKMMNELPSQRTQLGVGSQGFFASKSTQQNANVSGIVTTSNSQHKISDKPDSVALQEQKIRAQEKNAQMDMSPIQKTITQSNNVISAVDRSAKIVKQPIDEVAQTKIQDPVAIQKEYEKQNISSQQLTQRQTQIAHNEVESLDEYEQSLRGSQVVNAYTTRKVVPRYNENYEDNYVKETEKEAVIKKNKTKKKKKVKKTQKKKDVKISQTTNNVVKGFVAGGIVLMFIIFLIILLPKTKINIQPKEIDINESVELTAKVDQTVYDAERRLIPARLIERDVTYTKSFDATGTGDVTAQKAQGTITIYNEYNKSPQPLVATTRFLAEDGTLFRLVNATTVPGMDGDEPGKIEALVEADVADETGNIGPTKFSVPGFDGGPKEGKFYGVSEKAMAGGGTGGTGVAIVAEEDITRAKLEMTKEMPDYIQDQIAGLLRPENEVLLPEATLIEEVRSEASVNAGTMAEQFMYEIVSHVKVLVFSEDDVLAIMETNLDDKQQQYDADQIDVLVDYNNVVADFENQILEMKAHGKASVVATVNVDNFQEDITGQKHDDLLTIMEEKYGDEIEKITIERVVPGFPAFIADHISKFQFMTKITVEQVKE